jgi:hypothetical protein
MSSTSGIGARAAVATESTAPTHLTDTEASRLRTQQPPARRSISGLLDGLQGRRAEVAFSTGSYVSDGSGSEWTTTTGTPAPLAGRRSISGSLQGTSSRAEEDRAKLRVLVDARAGHYADSCCETLRSNGRRYKESAVNEYADAVLGLYSGHMENEDFAKSVDAARRTCHEKIKKLDSVNWRETNYFDRRATESLQSFRNAVSSAADKLDRPDAFQKQSVAPLRPRASLLTEQIKAYDNTSPK